MADEAAVAAYIESDYEHQPEHNSSAVQVVIGLSSAKKYATLTKGTCVALGLQSHLVVRKL
eukprot:6296329-Amphidinium_carterae.1